MFDPVLLELLWARLVSIVDEAAATLLRKATVMRPTRTANGSRHINMPLCNASIVTPGSKPSERKRCPS
jgi:hypothetical protein